MLYRSLRHLVISIAVFGSTHASASLYDIVCVECSVEVATYEFNDPVYGLVANGDLNAPTGSGDFQIDSFFGELLYAHNIEFFWGPGTYFFESVGDDVFGNETIGMTVNPGQIGMHFLFDWNGNTDIDVLNVFDVMNAGGLMTLTPTDVDGNGLPGFAMVEGPFAGVDMSTSFVVAAPIPAAAWLFASGLLALAGVVRREKA